MLKSTTRGRILVAAVLCICALGSGQSANRPSADQISDKQHERSQLNLTMHDLQNQIASAEDQQAKLQVIIGRLNASIAATAKQVTAAQTRLQSIDAQLSVAVDSLAATRAKLADDRAQLQRAMILTYKFDKDSTALGNLVSSGDFNEFFQHLLAARKVTTAEGDTVSRVTTEEASVRDEVAAVAAQKRLQAETLAALRAQVSTLDGELVTRENAQTLLQQLQASDQQHLLDAERSAREVDAQIAELQAAKAAAEAAAAAEAKRQAAAAAAAAASAAAAGRPAPAPPQSAGGSGHFSWPESGPITQGFGCTPYAFEPYDPHCASRHSHTGIDIGAPGGTPIGAADSGIAYTYYSTYGYGNHVIIIHAGGWVSLYGHMARFAVGSGQGVGRGDIIGYEGSTGNSTGPHLHFEIRLNNIPQNPFAYLP